MGYIIANKKEKIKVRDINTGKRKSQTATCLAIGFFTVFIMCTDGLFPLPKNGYIDIWSMCNWGLSYSTGFIVRGLVGTVMTALMGAITFKQIYIMSVVLFFVLMAGFVLININIYKKSQKLTAFILIFFLMAQPSNARWLMNGVMIARLDNFAIIFALIGFFIVYKFDDIPMYSVLLPLSILAILIHEIFAVAFASLLFALILIKTALRMEKLSVKPLLIYYLPVLAVFALVVIFGGTDLSREKFTMIMQQNMAEDMREGMISVARDIVVDDMSTKMERVRYLFTKDTGILMVLTYVVMSPTLILFGGMFVKLYKSMRSRFEKVPLIIIIGSCFAPLTSSFFGVDHFRWIGYFILCLSAAIVSLYFLSEKYREIILGYITKNAHYFIIASVIAMTFGTFRAMETMPLLEKMYYNRILVLPEFFR